VCALKHRFTVLVERLATAHAAGRSGDGGLRLPARPELARSPCAVRGRLRQPRSSASVNRSSTPPALGVDGGGIGQSGVSPGGS
jgi:hypothetical protein